MDATQLRELQAPLKARYREEPDSAVVTLHADGELDSDGLTCSVETGRALVQAGLHPATGGDGLSACSGDLLLEALVACAGVTLRAVATALDVPIVSGRVRAEGEIDFRGTLGVDREAPVGFRTIRLSYDLVTDAAPETVDKLIARTERACVVYQTLAATPSLPVEVHTSPPA